MSLKQKYTWEDFLKEKPELKAKGVKRTSKEGEKAFKAAFKAKIKEHLSKRTDKVSFLKKKAEEKKIKLTEKVKDFQKKKDFGQAKIYQKKVGKQDSWIGRLDKQESRVKLLQKSL